MKESRSGGHWPNRQCGTLPTPRAHSHTDTKKEEEDEEKGKKLHTCSISLFYFFISFRLHYAFVPRGPFRCFSSCADYLIAVLEADSNADEELLVDKKKGENVQVKGKGNEAKGVGTARSRSERP